MPGEKGLVQTVEMHKFASLCVVILLLSVLLSACVTAPAALPSDFPGAAASYAAETLQVMGLTKTLQAQSTAEWLTRQAPTLTPSPSATRPTATPMPSNTPPFSLLSLTPPTLTPSATMVRPTLVASVDTNCRVRPAPDEQRLGILLAGMQATVYGRNADGSWWYIENPDKGGEYCWVWDGAVTLSGETASLPQITPAPRPPTVDFEVTFSNAHMCEYDKFLIFRVENTGTETLYVATITIKDKKGDVLHTDTLWAPYMNESTWCPPGRYALESEKRGFVYIKKLHTIKSGVRLWALIEICTQDGPDKKCVGKELQFQF